MRARELTRSFSRLRLAAAKSKASLRMEWKLGIGMLLFAGVFVSGFFDSLIIQVLGKREVDREIRILLAGIVAGFLFLMALAAVSTRAGHAYRNRPRPFYEWPLLALLFLSPAWVAAGIINSWQTTYIVGDLFLLTVLPITYFVLVRHPLHDLKQVFKWFYAIMLFMAVLSSILVIKHNVIDGYQHKMSVDAAVVPTLYIMLKGSATWIEIALIPFFMIASVATSKRSTWGGMIIVFAIALLLRPSIRRWARVIMICALVGGILLIVIDEKPQWVDHTKTLLNNRMEETREDFTSERGDLSPTSGGRMGEIFGVYDTYVTRNSPVDWATGLGFGAVVHARGGRTRHHVHSTPATFLARTGIVGLALWVIFCFAVLAFLVKHLRRARDAWTRTQMIFWIGIWVSGMIFSIKSQAFWGSAVGGMQLAYIYHLARLAEAESPAPVTVSTRRLRAPAARPMVAAEPSA